MEATQMGHLSGVTSAQVARVLLCLSLAVSGGGCAVSALSSARTLKAGETQFMVAPSMMRISRGGAPVNLPFVEVATRHGFTDRVEGEARLSAFGLNASARVALARPVTPTDGVSVSAGVGVGYIGGFSGTATGSGDELHVFNANLPVLVGWWPHPKVELVAGPRLMYMAWTGDGSQTTSAHILSAGGTVGVGVQVTERLRIQPEIGFAVPVVRSLEGLGTSAGFGGGATWQFAVGFLIGKRPRVTSSKQSCP